MLSSGFKPRLAVDTAKLIWRGFRIVNDPTIYSPFLQYFAISGQACARRKALIWIVFPVTISQKSDD